jgi:hypothetical protein
VSRAAIHNPFFHVGFIVPDLDAAMEEFRVALGIGWRAPIDARMTSTHTAGRVSTVVGPENNPSRFTLQQSPHGFDVDLFDTATPRHADLLPKPSSERTDDEHS